MPYLAVKIYSSLGYLANKHFKNVSEMSAYSIGTSWHYLAKAKILMISEYFLYSSNLSA
jgi:hypothetical protein